MMMHRFFLILAIVTVGSVSPQELPKTTTVPTTTATSCSATQTGGAYGTKVATVYITGSDYKELDAACCAACNQNPECTFWIRSTEYTKDDYCWLMKKWDGNYKDSYYRMGMKQTSEMPCEALKFAYTMLGNVLKNVNINLGTTINNLRLELPSDDLQCEIHNSDGNTNQLFFLKNIALLANTSFNLTGIRNDPLDIGEGAYGTAQVALNVDPELSVDIETCYPKVAKLNLWNMGIGLNNYGRYQWWSNWLSGSYRSGLKSMKSCGNVVSAFPGLELYGYQVGYMKLDPSSQWDADAECCRACESNAECEGFLVEANRRSGPHQCWLYRLTYPNKDRHANFRGETVTLGEVGMYHGAGWRVGYHVLGDNQTQVEKDRHCGELCLETEGCYWWATSVSRPQCWLHWPFQQTGLFNHGILGISGRSIGNHMVNRMMWRMLKKVLSFVCGKNALSGIINSIMHLSAEVSGEAEFALDVARDFFGSANFSLEEPWGNATFPLVSAKTNIIAKHAAVQPFVDELVSDLQSSLAHEVAQQVAAPVGFFVAGLASQCMADKGKCMNPDVDVKLAI